MVTTTTAPLSAPLSGEARFGVYGAASPKRAIRQTPGGYVRGAGTRIMGACRGGCRPLEGGFADKAR
jgi:hypothetical protein